MIAIIHLIQQLKISCVSSATEFILNMLSTVSEDKLFINSNNDVLHLFDKV